MTGLVSEAVSGVDAAIKAVTDVCDDVGKTTQMLVGVSAALAKIADPAVGAIVAPDSLGGSVSGAIQNAHAAATGKFHDSFKDVKLPEQNVDGGVVPNYTVGSDLSCVTSQLRTNFANWQVDFEDADIGDMASTLANEVEQNGQYAPGASTGSRGLTGGSETFYWALSYGIFPIKSGQAGDQYGLVYGFAAVNVSGWGPGTG